MLYFPRPFPDELLGSVVGRACRETGLTHKKLVFAICGLRRTYSSIFLPSYLRRLAGLIQCDVEELIYAHSVFPYIVSFMSEVSAAKVRDLVLARRGISDGSFHSLTQSVTNGVTYRRLCRQCTQDDLSKFGTSYWHRAHLLPGVYFCIKHHCPLDETRIPVKNYGRVWSYSMPHEVDGNVIDFNLPTWALPEISSRSAASLEPRSQYIQSWTVRYRDLAVDKGYLTSAPFIAGRQLSQDLKSTFGAEFLLQSGCDYPVQRRNAWPALLVRPQTEVPFVPVKHILLHTFLSNCPTAGAPVGYRTPGPKPRDILALDAELSRNVQAGLLRWRRKLHEFTLAEFMTMCGCWSQYRHSRNSFPETSRLVERFKAASRRKST